MSPCLEKALALGDGGVTFGMLAGAVCATRLTVKKTNASVAKSVEKLTERFIITMLNYH